MKDSFELYVDLPHDYVADSLNSIVLYLDANLKFGEELRRQIRLTQNRENLRNVIFVGIGHIGNYQSHRRRDLIPPKVGAGNEMQSDDADFGHADAFYTFLREELMPMISSRYPNNGTYSLLGHSFGGLFTYYCFMKDEYVFKNYVALSPSLWVNYDNFFQREELFYQNRRIETNTTLYHSCGTGEWANKVLSTSRKMKSILGARKYPGLNYIYAEHKGADHNGVVPVSLEYVLAHVDFKPKSIGADTLMARARRAHNKR